MAPIVLAPAILLCIACSGTPPEDTTPEAKTTVSAEIGAERTQYVERTTQIPAVETPSVEPSVEAPAVPGAASVQAPEAEPEHPPGTPAEDQPTPDIGKVTDAALK
jgi:ABC-type uncharacterized transport system involved in gliding motility auxiliary subunit